MNVREPHTEPVREDWWTTEAAVVSKSAAWEQALRDCYLDWELTKPVNDEFHAQIRQKYLSEIRLVECQCSPCSGRRVLRQTTQEGEPFVGIQIVVDGGERFKIGDKTISVSKGDVVFWNSYESTEFEVVEDLHKVTLLMPQSLLESRLEMGILIRGGIVNTNTASGAMLYSHICALASQFANISDEEIYGIKWSSIELGAATAVWLQQPIISPSKEHTRRIQRYILAQLQNADLSVQRIADDNGISVRYVHSLFRALGCTVSQWIMERRLERCRDALGARRDGRGVVKDVAFQWGFNDTAHFSRVFKKRFGQTPIRYWETVHGPLYCQEIAEGF
ncbi:MAG: helix-turn-helix domain-containing protein [Hyphomicrobium sp.]